MTQPINLLFDHDGGVDDLISLLMLLAMPHVNLHGIAVTPADCYLRPATSATLKILRLCGRADIPVSQGTLTGINHFPRLWRKDAYCLDALPMLNDTDDPLPSPVPQPAHQFLADKLRQADTPLTILITGPVSNLTAALNAEPDLANKVENVLWMGGAFNVNGNVEDYEHDGSAEWNVYWDPIAAHQLWQHDIPLLLFPLDITNNVPVNLPFLHQLARRRRFPLADLAGQCWAMTVGTIPNANYLYYMWDTLTTGYLGAPHLFTTTTQPTYVIPHAPSAGRTIISPDKGRPTQIAQTVALPQFYDYLLDLFSQHISQQ
ncbi:MAG TPA: nucleoside hydrolase [Anaerolineae bacterium]|nr:nucleoside hydrolase [Anaerolineae bacterium]